MWEGIHNNTLRVLVTIDRAAEFMDDGTGKNTDESLRLAGRNRAGALLVCYARAHVTDRQRIEACFQAIPEIITKESVRFMKCSEDICTAVFDFNVERFLDAAEDHDSGR